MDGHVNPLVLCDQFLPLHALARPQGSSWPKVHPLWIYARARALFDSEELLKVVLRRDGVEITGFWSKFVSVFTRDSNEFKLALLEVVRGYIKWSNLEIGGRIHTQGYSWFLELPNKEAVSLSSCV